MDLCLSKQLSAFVVCADADTGGLTASAARALFPVTGLRPAVPAHLPTAPAPGFRPDYTQSGSSSYAGTGSDVSYAAPGYAHDPAARARHCLCHLYPGICRLAAAASK